MTYLEFLTSKRIKSVSSGIVSNPEDYNPILFPFQKDLVRWAVKKGRCAIFADTGLGKTFMQLEWARIINKRTLIVAPLSVAQQTIREGEKLGIPVHYVRSQEAANGIKDNILITNYDMIKAFDPAAFEAVVLDESSILKSLDGKTKKKLIKMFKHTPYKLCCTATPAPNDIAEIANHAEFLSIMNRTDMLAAFFVHDDKGWRLRGHGQTAFFRWLASWGMSIRKPSDLGYDDDGFILPPLHIKPIIVRSDYVPEGQLFFTKLSGIQDRQRIRRITLEERIEAAAEMINASDEQWLVWCGLNDESDALARQIADGIEVKGSDHREVKIEAIESFQNGETRVLITKPKIAGFGMNFQNCHNMAFVGLNDSWESYYQAIRRCYRFGQKSPVNVHIILSDIEQEIFANIRQKEAQANELTKKLIKNVQEYERKEIMMTDNNHKFEYDTERVAGERWDLILGDSVEEMKSLPSDHVDLSVFSPPFMDLFTYTPTERDLGNSSTPEQFFEHFGFIIDELLRVTKPGRICACHTADVPALLSKDGYIGLKDFPGMVIREFEQRDWIYHGRVTIDKNPQAQAIRTHSKALLFVQMEKDSSWSRPAIADYILIFRKPGDNDVAIQPVENGEMTRDQWIEWARPIWTGIRETDTLQYTTARDEQDDKHICPLQLGTIERCVALWSNPGELIFSPFAGIGSEIYQAVKMGRRGMGIELKRSYFNVAVRNLQDIERQQHEMTLFDYAAHQSQEIIEPEEPEEELPVDQKLRQVGAPTLPGLD